MPGDAWLSSAGLTKEPQCISKWGLHVGEGQGLCQLLGYSAAVGQTSVCGRCEQTLVYNVVVHSNDTHKNGSNFLVGVWGGLSYLSLSDRWGVTDGNGKWGEWHIFWHRCGTTGRRRRRKFCFGLLKGKIFFPTPYVCTQNARIFVENSNMGEKLENFFRAPDPTRPPSRPLAAGPSICHLSPVTRAGGLWGGGGRYGIHWFTLFIAVVFYC